MKNLVSAFLLLNIFCSCMQSSQNKSAGVKMDTVPIYDLNGNVVRDTFIRHSDSSAAAGASNGDTIRIFRNGKYAGDSIISKRIFVPAKM